MMKTHFQLYNVAIESTTYPIWTGTSVAEQTPEKGIVVARISPGPYRGFPTGLATL